MPTLRLREALLFAADAFAAALLPATWTPALRVAVARQVSQAAVAILPVFLAATVVLAAIVVRVVGQSARDFGLSQYATELFARVVVLELVPLFVALFVLLRSGAPFATDIALERQAGRPLDRDATLGRGIGIALAILALAALSAATALVAAYGSLYGFSPWGQDAFARAIGNVFSPVVLGGLAIKSLLFAVAVAALPAWSSLSAPASPHAVSEAAPRALVRAFVVLAFVEGVAVAVSYA
ncbi:MAG: ABC transporter permease [Betaproteobacteria bacterium]|nr:ABC transporter permease [Betaproteobacteria bacterium]